MPILEVEKQSKILMLQPLPILIKAWKNLLAKDRFAELFREMEQSLNSRSEAFNQLVRLRNRHSKVYQDEMEGTVSRENAVIEYNQISKALIAAIDMLAETDLGEGGALQDTLDTLVQSLVIDVPMTPLFLVNCNRRKELRSFRRSFGQRQEDCCRFQFYYILACPTQEPEGFAERVIYELMGEYADTHHHSIHYRRNDDARLRIENLPLGFTLKDTKEAFKKYFAERFNLGNTSFEDYLRTGLPRLQYEYVATTMQITAGDWDPDIVEDYLKWLMDSFSETDGRTPTFLFFFVVSLKNAHWPEKIRRDDVEVLDSVHALIEANEHRAALFSPLPPVPADDLEDWLEKLGSVSQTQKNAILQAIGNQLESEELARFSSEDRLLDMERIEDLQERVWRAHR